MPVTWNHHTSNGVQHSIFSYCNNGYTNTPQCNMYTAYWSTQPVREMRTRGISWGVKSSPPYTHDCIATPSPICTLTCWSTSFSFTLTVICPLALPLIQSLTPLFIIYTFKHSLNFFTSSLHILLYVISSLFPVTSHSLALSNCSSFSALSPTHSFFYPYWAEICCLQWTLTFQSTSSNTTMWPQLYTHFYWLCLECKLNFLC